MRRLRALDDERNITRRDSYGLANSTLAHTMSALPALPGLATDVHTLDCAFWGVYLRSGFTLQYRRWSFEHADAVVRKVVEYLGPDTFSTVLAVAPSLLTKQVRLVDAVTAILVERADTLSETVRGLFRSGLRNDALVDLFAVQHSTSVTGLALTQAVSGPNGVLAQRMEVFDSVWDVNQAALGCFMENIFPLASGFLASRSANPSTDPATATDLQGKLISRGETLALVRHLGAWLKIRGA